MKGYFKYLNLFLVIYVLGNLNLSEESYIVKLRNIKLIICMFKVKSRE